MSELIAVRRRRKLTSILKGRTAITLLRSFLFAPGNHARRVEKALTLDADAVILDLEDAVAIAEKPSTRGAIVAALRQPRRGALFVRVNASDTEFCYGDLTAVVRPGLDGIILPKVEDAAGLATVEWLLTQLEREHGLAAQAIDLIPIIETARGLDRHRCNSRGRHPHQARRLWRRRLYPRRRHDLVAR